MDEERADMLARLLCEMCDRIGCQIFMGIGSYGGNRLYIACRDGAMYGELNSWCAQESRLINFEREYVVFAIEEYMRRIGIEDWNCTIKFSEHELLETKNLVRLV